MRVVAGGVGLVLGLLSTAAVAADLGPYGRGSIKDEPVYVRPFSWTGFYVGAQIGYAWGNVDAVSGPITGFDQSYSYDADGLVGGGHVGYNWQRDRIVIGIEADIEASDISETGIGSLGYTHQTSVDWLGSVRGRLGVAMDRTLFYATAGWAFGDVEVTKAVAPGFAPFASYSDVRHGWTVGAGIEQAFTDRITGRIEYRYTDLGEGNFRSVPANSIDESELTFHALRAGLSIRF
jgi:outer membrane immunogenic protein